MERTLLIMDGIASLAMLWLSIQITVQLRKYRVAEARIGQWVVALWMIGTAGVGWSRFNNLISGQIRVGLLASVVQHVAAVLFQCWVLRVMHEISPIGKSSGETPGVGNSRPDIDTSAR